MDHASAKVREEYNNLAQCVAGVARDGSVPKLYINVKVCRWWGLGCVLGVLALLSFWLSLLLVAARLTC